MGITVTLPLPSPKLHAHAKGHWRGKADATRDLRELAWALAVQQLRSRRPRWERAVISIRFFWADNVRRDTLNAVQGIKPAIDGLKDAGVIADDCWQVLSVGRIESALDRSDPRVEITIEPERSDA